MILLKEPLFDITSVSCSFAHNAIQTTSLNNSHLLCLPTASHVFILQVTSSFKVNKSCHIKNNWKVEIDSVSCGAFGKNGELLVLARETRLFALRLIEQDWKQVFSHDMGFYPRAITIIDCGKYKFDIFVSGACGVVIVPCSLESQEKVLTTFLEGTVGHCCSCLTSLNNRIIAAATTDGRAALWLAMEERSCWKPVASLMPVHEAVIFAACDRMVDIGLHYYEQEKSYLLALGWWNGAVLVYTCSQDCSSYKLQWSRKACSNCHAWKDIPCGYLSWHFSGQQLIVCTTPFQISILGSLDGSLIQTVFVPSRLLCQGVSSCDEFLFLLVKNIYRSEWSVLQYCHVVKETENIT